MVYKFPSPMWEAQPTRPEHPGHLVSTTMNPALAEAIRANPFEGGGSDNVSVHNTTSVSAVDMKRTIKRVHLTCTKTLDEAKSAFSYHWR